jgi:SAM-dependent methyltransferase
MCQKAPGMNILTADEENIWEGFPKTYQAQGPQRLWRTHADSVHKDLVARWGPVGQIETLLKTDLFDEAVGDGLLPQLASQADRVFYIDTSFEVHQMARCRYPGLHSIVADVRRLPFAQDTFHGIVSNSTLDHFQSRDDLLVSLKELSQVLCPGGQMILTLDNLSNPIILLRNWLPFRLLKRLKIVPYYVGVTLGPHQLEHLLKENGFKVLEVDAIMHCPRMPAIMAARWLEKHTTLRAQRFFLRLLMAFEALSRLPTRFLTGYFIAIKAMRR